MTLLAVMIGGAIGSGLRYGMSLTLNPNLGDGIPWGTLSVNLLGCLLIGWAANWMSGSSEAIRLGAMMGVLGGFTTFSSFGLEAIRLFQSGQFSAAMFYILISNAGGLAGAWIGLRQGIAIGQ